MCSTRLDQHEGPSGISCTGKARCANCHGPFPAGHDSCPAAPVRRNGKTFQSTKKEIDAIQRHGVKNFRDALAAAATQPDPQPQPQTRGPQDNATTGQNKRKRASAIPAYENAGSRSTALPSQTSTTIPPPSQPTSSRPRRSTVSGKNLNLADLSAQSFAGSQEDMDTDTSESLC